MKLVVNTSLFGLLKTVIDTEKISDVTPSENSIQGTLNISVTMEHGKTYVLERGTKAFDEIAKLWNIKVVTREDILAEIELKKELKKKEEEKEKEAAKKKVIKKKKTTKKKVSKKKAKK